MSRAKRAGSKHDHRVLQLPQLCQYVAAAHLDRERRTRMSIMNVANMGKFSSDRSIREYASEVWHAESVPVDVNR